VGKGGNTERDVNREVARREKQTKSTQRQEEIWERQMGGDQRIEKDKRKKTPPDTQLSRSTFTSSPELSPLCVTYLPNRSLLLLYAHPRHSVPLSSYLTSPTLPAHVHSASHHNTCFNTPTHTQHFPTNTLTHTPPTITTPPYSHPTLSQ